MKIKVPTICYSSISLNLVWYYVSNWFITFSNNYAIILQQQYPMLIQRKRQKCLEILGYLLMLFQKHIHKVQSKNDGMTVWKVNSSNSSNPTQISKITSSVIKYYLCFHLKNTSHAIICYEICKEKCLNFDKTFLRFFPEKWW